MPIPYNTVVDRVVQANRIELENNSCQNKGRRKRKRAKDHEWKWQWWKGALSPFGLGWVQIFFPMFSQSAIQKQKNIFCQNKICGKKMWTKWVHDIATKKWPIMVALFTHFMYVHIFGFLFIVFISFFFLSALFILVF